MGWSIHPVIEHLPITPRGSFFFLFFIWCYSFEWTCSLDQSWKVYFHRGDCWSHIVICSSVHVHGKFLKEDLVCSSTCRRSRLIFKKFFLIKRESPSHVSFLWRVQRCRQETRKWSVVIWYNIDTNTAADTFKGGVKMRACSWCPPWAGILRLYWNCVMILQSLHLFCVLSCIKFSKYTSETLVCASLQPGPDVYNAY